MNQKGFANIILVAVVVILVGVAGYLVFVKKATTPPPVEPSQSTSFNFVFRYGLGPNKLDTFEKTYTRDMILDPPVKIEMSLTEEEMNRIFQKMIEIKFFDYPDEFFVTVLPWVPTGTITPCPGYYFKVDTGSRIKELSWYDCITNENEEADKLRELIRYIENIIESKKEYKELPTPKGGYM